MDATEIEIRKAMRLMQDDVVGWFDPDRYDFIKRYKGMSEMEKDEFRERLCIRGVWHLMKQDVTREFPYVPHIPDNEEDWRWEFNAPTRVVRIQDKGGYHSKRFWTSSGKFFEEE